VSETTKICGIVLQTAEDQGHIRQALFSKKFFALQKVEVFAKQNRFNNDPAGYLLCIIFAPHQL